MILGSAAFLKFTNWLFMNKIITIIMFCITLHWTSLPRFIGNACFYCTKNICTQFSYCYVCAFLTDLQIILHVLDTNHLSIVYVEVIISFYYDFSFLTCLLKKNIWQVTLTFYWQCSLLTGLFLIQIWIDCNAYFLLRISKFSLIQLNAYYIRADFLIW